MIKLTYDLDKQGTHAVITPDGKLLKFVQVMMDPGSKSNRAIATTHSRMSTPVDNLPVFV